MLVRERWIGLMEFRLIERRAVMYRKCKTRITVQDRGDSIVPMCEPIPFTEMWTPTGGSFFRTSKFVSRTGNLSSTLRKSRESLSAWGRQRSMNLAKKNFHSVFACVSLGIALLALGLSPRHAYANSSNNSSMKRDAASSQFGRAEELRETLNSKLPEKRTLAEYKQVVNSYRRVYLITPHAVQVPDALLAVAELNTEMGDRFGRSYYQTAVESYQFLIREYPSSKYVPDAMLSIARLQNN